MAKPPADWSKLHLVIQYAESLGPGNVVFRDTGNTHYGVCTVDEFNTAIVSTGRVHSSYSERSSASGKLEFNHGYALFGRAQKRQIVFITREKR